MKKILTLIILLFAFFLCKAQNEPTGVPSSKTRWYQGDYVQALNGLFGPVRDTNWTPRYPFAIVLWQNAGVDTVLWQYDGFKWNKVGSGGSGSSTFFGLSDVDSSGIQNLFTPYYDLASGNILFQAPGTSPIIIGSTTYHFQDSTNTPPVSFPVGIDSVYYMIGGAGTGIFSGHNYEIALYVSGVFDSFIAPTLNDWGLVLTGVAQGTWHQYNGSTWPRRNYPQWVTIGNFGGGILGSTNAANVYFRYNSQNRIIFQNNGIQYPTHTGASAGIMGLSIAGLSSNVQPGVGVIITSSLIRVDTATIHTSAYNDGRYLQNITGLVTAGTDISITGAGTAGSPYVINSTAGGSQGLQDVITTDPVLTANNTITGTGLNWTHNTGQYIINASDSALIVGNNKVSLVSLDSVNARGAVLYFKGANAWFGGTNIAALFVDSVGIRIQNGLSYMIGTTTGTGSIARIDPTTKALGYSSTINAATELTGIVPVENGGTEVSSLTAYGLIFGGTTTTGPVQTLTNGTSGYYLKSNGASALPSWETTAGLSPWTRGVYDALASTNIVHTVVHADTVVVGASLASIFGLFNVSGRSYFTGNVGIGTAPNNATYELNVSGDIKASGTAEIDDKMTVNTFGAAVAGQALTVGLSNVSGGGGIFIGTNAFGQSGTGYGVKITPIVNQTSTSTGVGFIGVFSNISASNSATPVSNFWIGLESRLTINSTNATNIVFGDGLKTSLEASLGTQKFTTYNALHDYGITTNNTLVSGDYFGLKIDSFPSLRVTGNIYPIYILSNSTTSQINIIQPKTSIGTTTTPTAWGMFGAGTTGVASMRILPGVAPTSPNDGDNWYEDTNDRLMFRQNATSVEILGVSAVSSVSPTAQNRTLTIVYNGVTYYLTAKTTND